MTTTTTRAGSITTVDLLTDTCTFVVLDAQKQMLISVPDKHIEAGTFDFTIFPHIKREYVAGPMRGYEKWNFPAFDRARDKRLAQGIQIISPADLDRWRGFDEDATEFGAGAFEEAMRIDTWALLNCTGIFLLKGWQDSTGARYELAIALATGLGITFDDDAEQGTSVISSVVAMTA